MYGTNIFGFQTLILTGTISKMRTRLRPHYILTTLFTSLEPFGFQTLTLTGTISKRRTRLRPHTFFTAIFTSLEPFLQNTKVRRCNENFSVTQQRTLCVLWMERRTIAADAKSHQVHENHFFTLLSANLRIIYWPIQNAFISQIHL